jgi:hypothetical protein
MHQWDAALKKLGRQELWRSWGGVSLTSKYEKKNGITQVYG